MLTGLRHRAVICSHHQQHKIDAGRARQHVVHQLFVSRHIDKSQHLAVRQGRVCVTEIDGDSARLLLLETVGIHAGERLHQRSLAVVDVSCGADDHGEMFNSAS